MTDTQDKTPGEVVHLAGPDIRFDTRIRQRCAWCSYILIDEDLTRIQVEVSEAGKPIPTWPIGSFVGIVDTGRFCQGRIVQEAADSGVIPEGCCMALPPELTV